MKYYSMEKLHQLHDGYSRAFVIEGNDLLLVQNQGQVHIVENRCTHMDAPLTHASIKNGILKCPLHGIEFELESGKSVTGCVGALKKRIPSYEGNTIGVVL